MDDDHPEPDLTELPSTEALPSSGEHRQVGPYRLLEKLGEGGMGEVWLAEQTEPVRRRVALKIIKRGMDTERIVARFEAERQALALMNHPNVAKVFDAGATPHGRPYFAMEHVQGVPITEHCDRQRLNTRQRLELFQQVCGGVQHAHQKGIIHRDIKPSNVLVQVQDAERVPKIIDFGVAKATQQRLTEKTLYTQMGQLVGTPEYMSPEQAEMTAEDIDTRTDVYSLGVVLYQLLVGALPFDSKELRKAGFDEIRRRIREQEPSRPSQKVSTLGDASVESAQRRHTDVSTLRRQLKGDLDCIVMKALEKDRARRYGSPQELAADIGRHLAHEPVLASPPSVAYRTGKFVRRHRVGVATAALTVALLVAFTVTTAIQSRRIAREARTSERVSEFLANMLGEVDPEAFGRLLVTDLRERVESVRRERGAHEEEVEAQLGAFDEAMRGVNATNAGLRLLDEQVLARAARTVEQQLADEPRIAGRLEHTLGQTYSKLGLGAQAESHTRRAIETRQRLLGPRHPDTLASKSQLGEELIWGGRLAEAELLLRETLEIQRRVLGNGDERTASTGFLLGAACGMQGRREQAEALYREALAIQRRVLGDEHPATLRSMAAVATVTANQGRRDEAEALQLEALQIKRRVLGAGHRDTALTALNLAAIYAEQGRAGEAEELYREALESHRRALGDSHPQTALSVLALADLLRDQKRFAEAEALYREALETSMNAYGEDHPETLQSMNVLADFYRSRRRYAEAEVLHFKALAGRRAVLGDDHLSTIQSMYRLAIVYRDRGRLAEAEPLLLETFERERRVKGEDHPDTIYTMRDLARLYRRQGRLDDAEPYVVGVFEARRRVLGRTHEQTIFALRAVADLYWEQGRIEESRARMVELLGIRREKAEAEGADADSKNAYAWVIQSCEPADLRDPQEALRFALEANEMAGFTSPHHLDTLAGAYYLTGRTALAADTQRKALALLEEGSSRRGRYAKRLALYEAAPGGEGE